MNNLGFTLKDTPNFSFPVETIKKKEKSKLIRKSR